MTLTLKPFQNDGVRFLAPQTAAILGDDTGLGKTAQLIRAADARLAERILIICQPISVVSWKIELPKWQMLDRPVFVLNKVSKPIPAGPVAVVVTYDWLGTRKKKELDKLFGSADRFDLCLMDEAQSAKTYSAARTKAVYGAFLNNDGVITRMGRDGNNPPPVWLSSATLRPNHAGELYTHLKALFPHVLIELFGTIPRRQQFEDRFCNVVTSGFGRKIAGDNRKEVQKLKAALAPYMLVRAKADVLGELDPITCLELPLDVDLVQWNVLVSDIHSDLSKSVSDDELLEVLNEQGLGEVSSERKILGEAKAREVLPWIMNFLESGKKLIVFAHHRSVIDYLQQALGAFYAVGVIDGRTDLGMKTSIVNMFQNTDTMKVIIGQTIAAGTSITLTAADTVLVLEPDWNPANNYQAISRAHRMGQSLPVTAYFAYAAGTLDERITRVLRRKAQDAALFLGITQTGGHI